MRNLQNLILVLTSVLCVSALNFTDFEQMRVGDSIEGGHITYYADYFHGRVTHGGEVYDMNMLTAASPVDPVTRRWKYPYNSILRVTNLDNNCTVIVRVTDTGSFKEKYGRELDLSKGAFEKIANTDTGVLKNTLIEVLGTGERIGDFVNYNYTENGTTHCYTQQVEIPELVANY